MVVLNNAIENEAAVQGVAASADIIHNSGRNNQIT
jgi:hypothetical protein